MASTAAREGHGPSVLPGRCLSPELCSGDGHDVPALPVATVPSGGSAQWGQCLVMAVPSGGSVPQCPTWSSLVARLLHGF